MSRRKAWTSGPTKTTKPKVPEHIREMVDKLTAELVKAFLKPNFIKPPPAENNFNYIVDIYTKWYRNYLYLCAKYNCPSPNAIAPSFESKFARLEYVGEEKYSLSFMRHTEQWCELYNGLTAEECLKIIKEDPNFLP